MCEGYSTDREEEGNNLYCLQLVVRVVHAPQYFGLKSNTGTLGPTTLFSGSSDSSLMKISSNVSASFSSLKLKSWVSKLSRRSLDALNSAEISYRSVLAARWLITQMF